MHLRFLLPLFLALIWCSITNSRPVSAQDVDERQIAEKRLESLQDQIQQDEVLLSQKVEEEQASLKLLHQLDRDIKERGSLIYNYRVRIRHLRVERDTIKQSLAKLELEIERLKQEYKQRAVHIFKYGRLRDLSLILAAESVNQMLIRVRYLSMFARQRRRKLDQIRQRSQEFSSRSDALQANLDRTAELLSQEQNNREVLTRRKDDRQHVIDELRAEKSTISQQVEEMRASVRELETRIRELIAAETTRRRAGNSTERNAAYIEMSGSFEQNKGKLPWPTEGVITEPYGEIVNPVYGTTTPNPGILIATPPAVDVLSVFDGDVISVDIIPNFGTYVVIAHGAYHSVYSNFSQIFVSKGQHVRAGMVIGYAGTEDEPKGRGIFFALFKGGQPINPLPWLSGHRP